MASSVVRPFRGVSAEERQLQRRKDLLEAGYDEVGENGVAKLTMTAVCERAGLTQRYFYEHFKTRNDLLVSLFDNIVAELFTLTRAAVEAAPVDLLERSRATMTVFVDYFAKDQRKGRMFSEATGNEAVAARKVTAVQAVAAYAASQAEIVYGPFEEREKVRVNLAAMVVVGGQGEIASQWINGSIDLTHDEFIDEVARMYVAAVASARRV